MPVKRKISTLMADLAEPNKSKQKVYKVGRDELSLNGNLSKPTN
jgi:hypothetical protein